MVKILTMPFGYFEACCYLIQMPTATCLIDPAVRPDLLPPAMPPIRWLLATHGHFDHISQADALRQATGAPLWIHEADSLCLTQAVRNMSMALQRPAVLQPAEKYLEDGQILILADGYSLEIIHTPGHIYR
jgi:hydroxyacylglutathione hydrolase